MYSVRHREDIGGDTEVCEPEGGAAALHGAREEAVHIRPQTTQVQRRVLQGEQGDQQRVEQVNTVFKCQLAKLKKITSFYPFYLSPHSCGSTQS